MRNIMESIHAGEGMELELKGSLPKEAVRWLKTVVAFANGCGGAIVVGVDDDRNVIGLPEEDVFGICDLIVSMVMGSCTPQIAVSPSVKRLGDKVVIIVDVYPGNGRPYHITDLGEVDGTFVRIGGTTRQADGFILQDLRLQGCKRSFDSLMNTEIQVTDARTSSICRSFSDYGDAKVTERILVNSGAILDINGRQVATNAYALLSEDSPFRFTEIRCGAYKGVSGAEFIDRAEYSCPIQEQVRNAFAFVKRNIRLGGRIDGLYRRDRYEVPIDSIRELIVNAVQHRSYVDPSRASYVAIYDDRIEITSPGGLPNSLNVDMMRQGRSSHRNPVISKVFRAAGYCEGWANGVSSVFDECRRYGLRDPVIENSGIDVKVTMFRPTYVNGIGDEGNGGNPDGNGGNPDGNGGNPDGKFSREESAQEPGIMREKIVIRIQDNPRITLNNLAKSIGVSQSSIERCISEMKTDGLLSRTGHTRSGQWVLHVDRFGSRFATYHSDVQVDG